MGLYTADTQLLPFGTIDELQKCEILASGGSSKDKRSNVFPAKESISVGLLKTMNAYLCVTTKITDASEPIRSGIASSDGRTVVQRPGFDQTDEFASVSGKTSDSLRDADPGSQFDTLESSKLSVDFQKQTVANLTIARPRTVDRDVFEKEGDSFSERLSKNLGFSRDLGSNKFISFERLVTTNKFLLQSVSSPRVEKFQIVETFGNPILYFFGGRHEIYTFTGVLIDSNNFRWKRDFLDLYEQFLRGTRCAELGASAFINYKDDTVEGFVVNTTLSENVNFYGALTFSFSMVIRKRKRFTSLVTIEQTEETPEASSALVTVRGVESAINDLLNPDSPVQFNAEQVATSSRGQNV